MCPSRSTLDRLPKELSARWERHREAWEAALREMETIPHEAAVLAVSLDGVMAPMKDAGRVEKRSQADKQAQGPAGDREFGCGTVSYYAQERERLATIRYGRMPEYKKTTLCQQLEAEVQSILALRPDLKVVKLADGAQENWRFLSKLDLGLSAKAAAQVEQLEIVDFYHAADHLKEACDAIWDKDKVRSQAEFERWRTLLKENVGGVEQVIPSSEVSGPESPQTAQRTHRKTVDLFSQQPPADAICPLHCAGPAPLAVGLSKRHAKTLVTQRMKQSGMAWRQSGGQAILTLRSLIQSNRWKPCLGPPARWFS